MVTQQELRQSSSVSQRLQRQQQQQYEVQQKRQQQEQVQIIERSELRKALDEQAEKSSRLKEIDPRTLETAKVWIERQASGKKGAGAAAGMYGYGGSEFKIAIAHLSTPQVRRVVSRGASALQTAREYGFRNIQEYQKHQGFAGKGTKLSAVEKIPYGSYLEPATSARPQGRVIRLSREELEKGLQEGSIGGGGWYKAAKGDPYAGTVTTYTTTQVETRTSEIPSALQKKDIKDVLKEERGITIRIPDVIDRSGTYSKQLGGYVSTSPTGEKGTVYYRPATLKEKIEIKEGTEGLYWKKKGDIAIERLETGVEKGIFEPAKYIGGKVVQWETAMFYAKTGIKETPSPSYIGEKVKQIKSRPSSVVDFFKQKSDVVIDTDTGVYRPRIESDFKLKGSDILTSKEAIKSSEKIGQNIGRFGVYTVPIVGATAFSIEVAGEFRKSGYSPKRFLGEKPVETGIVLGAGLFIGGRTTSRFLKAPKVIEKAKDSYLLTTRGQQLFGKRLKVSYKKGDNIINSKLKFEIVPTDKYLGIKFKKVTPKSIETKPLLIREKEEVLKSGDITADIFKGDLLAQKVISGEKTIISKPTKKGEEIVFEGESFTKIGKVQKERAIKLLGDFGVGEKSAKQLLKLKQPEVISTRGKFSEVVLRGEEGSKTLLTGRVEIQKLPEKIGNVKTRLGKRQVRFIDEASKFLKAQEKGDLALFSELSTKAYRDKRLFSKLSQEGKTTERFTGISKIRKISETDAFTFHLGESYTVRTIPKQRKIQKSEEIGILTKKSELEATIDIDKLNELRGIIKKGSYSINTGTKKSSQQYLKQLYLPKSEIKDVTEKVINLLPKKQTTQRVISEGTGESLIGLPRMVGGKGLTEVQTERYIGKVGYEQEFISLPPRTQEGIISNVKVDTGIDVKEINIQKPSIEIKTRIKQEQIMSQLSTQKERVRERQEESLIQRIKERVEILPKLKEGQLLKQGERVDLGLLDRQTPKPKRPREPPFTPIIDIPDKPSLVKRLARKVREEPDLFSVFVRKGGKDIEIEKVRTPQEAKSILVKQLKGTLRASGIVKKKGKVVPLKELGTFGFGFRRGKKERERLVQLKTQRLGTGGETKEIQFFRKKKKKKNLFF